MSLRFLKLLACYYMLCRKWSLCFTSLNLCHIIIYVDMPLNVCVCVFFFFLILVIAYLLVEHELCLCVFLFVKDGL